MATRVTLELARKSPHIFPGGYALVGLMDDGTMLCGKCLNEDEVHVEGEADGWRVEAIDAYWEGPTATCSHCGGEVPSEYGDPATTTLSTVVHTYRFDVSKDEDFAAHAALVESLRSTHPRMSLSSRSFEDGHELELEVEHIFSNQWNTACGHRVYDWCEWGYPNPDIKAGYWLYQSDAMKEARRNTVKCGYCGSHKQAAQGYGFCLDCLGSEHLKRSDLHLLRLKSAGVDRPTRAALTDAEAERMGLEYDVAQEVAFQARTAKLRLSLVAKRDAVTRDAAVECEGKLWLLDNGLDVRNVIYYPHTGRWMFGWHGGVDPAWLTAFMAAPSEFPYSYDVTP